MAATGQKGDREVLIALMGMTGAGKTTFARAASGDQTLKVGHSIYPCTQDPQIVPLALDGRQILLIDTPGFDDDDRSDVQILEDIATWLAKRGYLKGSHQLDGLILLHPVTMHRLGGNERRRTRLLQNLLGQNAYKRIIIATTMWERITDEKDVEMGLKGREKDIWYDLVSKGAKIRKHNNNPDSAHKIIREIVKLSEKHGKLEPLIQTELAKDPRLVKTTAGKSMKRDLEADIARAKTMLMEHIATKPQEPGKAGKYRHPKKWKEHKEWVEEKREIETRLARLEARLDKLDKFNWSSFFAGLFGRR